MNSFVPGTLVLLANGTRAAIESLKVGDEVLATDPETGDTTAEPVVATITGTGEKDLVQITVTDSAGATGTVEATVGHPFWVPDIQEWVDAGDLRAGQWLQTSSGTWVLVTAVEYDHREQTVHNLTIDTAHTYNVYAGNTDLLTHNCGGAGPVRAGQAGEEAVRAGFSIGDKSAQIVNGRLRIFDGLSDVAVSEVKNVRYQAFTRQLGDSLDYAAQNELRFDLFVRGGANPTVLSGPLADAIRSVARFNLNYIP